MISIFSWPLDYPAVIQTATSNKDALSTRPQSFTLYIFITTLQDLHYEAGRFISKRRCRTRANSMISSNAFQLHKRRRAVECIRDGPNADPDIDCFILYFEHFILYLNHIYRDHSLLRLYNPETILQILIEIMCVLLGFF